MDEAQRLQVIGERAASEVSDGDKVGLGTGSTANAMLDALAARVRAGLQVNGVATSDSTRARCAQLGIPLLDLDEVDHLDLCIDGADEIDPNLNLVKGKGGALLYEKLVALRTDRLIIIASSEKLVTRLGTRLPVPVEVVPFGHHHTAKALAELGLRPVLRQTSDNAPFITEGGHYIFDCESGGIDDPVALGASLKSITGVIDHGLFTGMTALALTIDESGTVAEHTSPAR
jgi:ribose 5-phosphate isomerase A